MMKPIGLNLKRETTHFVKRVVGCREDRSGNRYTVTVTDWGIKNHDNDKALPGMIA